MTALLISEICDGIKDTLFDGVNIVRGQSYDQLTESMNDWPTLQVYPDQNAVDAFQGTDRTTFGGGIRVKDYIIFADLYARQRSDIAEDMNAVVNAIDFLEGIFEQQNTSPYFGVAGIKNFRWAWRRFNFVLGDPNIQYPGARFTINVRVF